MNEHQKLPLILQNYKIDNRYLCPKKTHTIKETTTGSWKHAAVQFLNNLSTKYRRTINDSPSEEDSDLLFLKSLLPNMKEFQKGGTKSFSSLQ